VIVARRGVLPWLRYFAGMLGADFSTMLGALPGSDWSR
jgi:hypothetical protein